GHPKDLEFGYTGPSAAFDFCERREPHETPALRRPLGDFELLIGAPGASGHRSGPSRAIDAHVDFVCGNGPVIAAVLPREIRQCAHLVDAAQMEHDGMGRGRFLSPTEMGMP